MFNGILKSDDVEVYETNNQQLRVFLKDECKSNVIVRLGTGGWDGYLSLPNSTYIGKTINITCLYGTTPTDKGIANGFIYIQHSNATLFTLKQGTVSFMYVGQQLNGLTATDKAKSGWVIIGGVQGDTAITGYAGSVAIGSGAYCGDLYGVALGNASTANNSAVALGASSSSTANNSSALGTSTTASGVSSTAVGQLASTTAIYSLALGHYAYSPTSKISMKANPRFSVSGDAQAGKFILMRQTADATPLVMSATNAAASTTNILILPNNGTYAFKGIVVAKDATTLDSAMWEVTALMKRGANASTTALVGTPTVTKVFNDAGAAAWTIALTADTTNGGGTITVTGEAGKTIRWISNIDSAELI